VKKKFTIGCLAIVFIIVMPFVGIIALFGGMMTSAPEALVDEYKEAAEMIGASWQELVAFDTVRFENEFDDADPFVSAMEFMAVYYEYYVWVETDEDAYWEMRRSGTLNTPDGIKSFFGLSGRNVGVNDVIKSMDSRNQSRARTDLGHYYYFEVYSKDIETVMLEHKFDQDQEEWMGLLLIEGIITAMFGGDVPDFIADAGRGMFAWPLPSIPESRVTSRFGSRVIEGKTEFHYGVDIGCAVGTPVIAAEAGVVRSATTSGGTAGTMVTITHHIDGNTWITKYYHLSELRVRAGQEVSRGSVIALSGNTGRSFGAHLHFEVEINGMRIDPLPLITGH